MGRITDYGSAFSERYIKQVEDSNNRSGKLEFCISEQMNGKYDLHIQTPFYRAPLKYNFSSAKACEKFIADLVRERPEDIRGTMKLFHDAEKFKEEMHRIMDDDTKPLEERYNAAGELKKLSLTL